MRKSRSSELFSLALLPGEAANRKREKKQHERSRRARSKSRKADRHDKYALRHTTSLEELGVDTEASGGVVGGAAQRAFATQQVEESGFPNADLKLSFA
jgi:hypothetical protein